MGGRGAAARLKTGRYWALLFLRHLRLRFRLLALEVAENPGREHLALLLGKWQPRALAQAEHVLDERLGECERLVAGVGIEAMAGRDDAAQDEVEAGARHRRAGLDAAVAHRLGSAGEEVTLLVDLLGD